MGQIIKVLMITASGAEGISLRNVRYVHIMEPYWHPVRIEQVIGRARRICSHNDLKEERLRTVNVMLYVMSFTPKQMSEDSSLELRMNDVSKRDAKKPLTTDQSLFEISTIKEEINRQLLMAVKEASIDCSIHRNVASKEKLKCFTFGVVKSDKFSYAPSIDNEESDASVAQNTKETELKLVKLTLTVGGVKSDYAYDKVTNNVYDYNSYLAAKEMGGEPLMVGKIMEKDGSKSFIVRWKQTVNKLKNQLSEILKIYFINHIKDEERRELKQHMKIIFKKVLASMENELNNQIKA